MNGVPGFFHEAERVLHLRAAFAHGHLSDEKAAGLRLWLVALDSVSEEPVTLHLSAEDAGLRAALAVADTVEAMRSPVHAYVTGQVGGPALAILAAAQRRTMTRRATVRLTEPQEKFDGTAAQLVIRESEHRWLVDALYGALGVLTGRPVDEIRDDAVRGRLFTSTQALAYGFVDQIGGFAGRNLSSGHPGAT